MPAGVRESEVHESVHTSNDGETPPRPESDGADARGRIQAREE